MVGLRIPVTDRGSFRILVIFPLLFTGLAITCAAAALMCLSSLTVLSIPPGVSDLRYAEYRLLPGAQPLPTKGFWHGMTAGLASAGDGEQDVQSASFASRFLPMQPPLRSDLRNGAAADLASAANGRQPGIQFIRFDEPTLAPMAFTLFCMKYPTDCKPQPFSLGGSRIELNNMRWSELERINRAVNSSIHAERNENGLAGEKWLLSPLRGDCNDYAVTKRHQLIFRGWPARSVLLSEVVTASGEHHLVTVVRTSGGDLVLDNLTDQIKPWSRTPYRWLRIQTPKNPNYWASIAGQSA